jgi:hypothetical protein
LNLIRTIRIAAGLAVLSLFTVPASAQQRPLVTEDPETIGAGLILAEAGLDYSWDVVYPASGLTGTLLRLPTVGLSLGVSSIAEIQVDAGLYNRLAITQRVDAPLSGMLNFTGDETSDFENIFVGAKVRLAGEGPRRPAFGIRFATRLPTTSNESGLGLDTMDFHFSLLAGKTVQSVRVVGNIGFAILSDPTRGDRQNDVLIYGVSFARALTQAAELVGEVNGRLHTAAYDPPPGTESRAIMRLGARYTVGPGRVDGGILLGMTSRDPSFGVMAGFTYVFNAFRVP